MLSEARERYEERRDAVEQEDPRSGETRAGPVPLLRDRALAESAEVRDKLGLTGKTGRAYVEDGDLTYRFEYGRDHSDCPAQDEGHGSDVPTDHHRVWVYYPAEEPSEDDTVLDAETKGVTEHEYLSRIFERAHAEYERREDDLRESSDRTELVEERDSELGTSDIREELDADAPELGARGVYVEYKGYRTGCGPSPYKMSRRNRTRATFSPKSIPMARPQLLGEAGLPNTGSVRDSFEDAE